MLRHGEAAVSLDSTVARNDDLAVAAVGTDLVILHPGRNAYYNTDEIGADVWQRLTQPTTVTELCDALLGVYDVERSTLIGDVLHFLEEARSQDLIRVVN